MSGIVPGESMMLRDLVLGGDPVRVREKSDLRAVRPWDRLATRLLQLGDASACSHLSRNFATRRSSWRSER